MFLLKSYAFAGGIWIIPALLLIGAAISARAAIKSHKSNSTTQVELGTPGAHTEDNTGDVPYSKIPYTYAAVGLFVLAVVFVIFRAVAF